MNFAWIAPHGSEKRCGPNLSTHIETNFRSCKMRLLDGRYDRKEDIR